MKIADEFLHSPLGTGLTPLDRGVALLDQALSALDREQVGACMELLFGGLPAIRAALGPERWRSFTADILPEHPVLARIHEDPVTRHSFERPRGYPGDAELIDYLYGVRGPEGATPAGRAIYAWCTGRVPCRGVRHRREWLASVIDAEAVRTAGRARVLSVACGHLREADLSGAFYTGWLDEVVALDGDGRSLEVAARSAPELVHSVEMSVARLPRRASRLGTFDLVYSAGLYDYLDEPLARSLTTALFGLLRPGGRLVVGNFRPDVADSAYMEAFMAWRLIYRDEADLAALFDDVAVEERTPLVHSVDPYGAFGYVECRRR